MEIKKVKVKVNDPDTTTSMEAVSVMAVPYLSVAWTEWVWQQGTPSPKQTALAYPFKVGGWVT